MTRRGPLLLLLLLLLLCLGGTTTLHAQDERACNSVRINAKGTAGATITVDATTGGVVVAEANTSRCALWFINETVNPLRCASSTGKYPLTVTPTVGAYIPASWYLTVGWAAQAEWKCIRTSGTSTTITIIEELP